MTQIDFRCGCLRLILGLLLATAWGCDKPEVAESPVPTVDREVIPPEMEPGPSDDDAPTEFTTTESGLKYRVLRKGDGKTPTAQDTVQAHYRGTLDDGTEFDSSYKRKMPSTFGLDGVIAGWTEGLQHVAEGGKIELDIPSELGYAENGSPPKIPPHARLHFIVELIKVNP